MPTSCPVIQRLFSLVLWRFIPSPSLMLNVNLNSAVIRRLFRSESESSRQLAPTKSGRQAAAAAADSEDAIGTASTENTPWVHHDFIDWDRHRRLVLDGYPRVPLGLPDGCLLR